MTKRLKQVAIGFIVVVSAAQLIRPDRASPPTDPSHSIQAQVGTSSALAAVLDRSCRDCHSNDTEWRWYTQVAPLSWLMASGVKAGRDAVNFSEWTGYPLDRQRALLAASCQAVKAGKMPGAYAWLRPETRLSPDDIETICAATR